MLELRVGGGSIVAKVVIISFSFPEVVFTGYDFKTPFGVLGNLGGKFASGLKAIFGVEAVVDADVFP